jgi:hypothetical protein
MCELRIDSRDPELASLQRREPRFQLRCQLDPAMRAHERASRHPESCDSHVAEEVLDEVLRDGGVRELQQLERRVVEDRDLPAVLLVADPPLRGVAVYELPEGLATTYRSPSPSGPLRLHILVARRGLREEVPAAARPLDRLISSSVASRATTPASSTRTAMRGSRRASDARPRARRRNGWLRRPALSRATASRLAALVPDG